MNIFRRLPLSRLLLLCGAVLVAGVSVTALAMALGSGPTPPAKPLAEAVHDALAGAQEESIDGVTASVQLTNHLLEGAELAGAGNGGPASSPLISGASGRLWIAKDGHLRLELQSEQGDTQILYDGHTIELYDAASNTLYRYTPPADSGQTGAASGQTEPTGSAEHEVPSVAKIEEGLAHLQQHTDVSGATPTDVAGRAAYTVRVSPKEGGSLLGGAELSFDAANGLPLRSAIYSSTSSSPVIELAASQISYGPVDASVFAFTPPANARVEEVKLPADSHRHSAADASGHSADRPKLTTSGQGPSTIAVLASKGKGDSSSPGASGSEEGGGLPQVKINGATATELRTELGTVLSFEREGVRYIVAGSRPAADIEAFARGL